MKKNCCWVYYLEPDSNIIDKVNVVLELLNYATKKELEHATGMIHLIHLLKKILLLSNLKLTK